MNTLYNQRLFGLYPSTSIIMIVVLLFLISSCNTFNSKTNYLSDFENFVQRTEKEYINYTYNEWEVIDNEYENYTGELYDKVYTKLTQEDQRNIGKLKGRYHVIKLKVEFKRTIQVIKDGIEQASGAVDEILNDNTDEIISLIIESL